MFDVTLLKAQIRSILLALGRGATEREFRREYYEIEGKSFNEVIQECGFNSIVTFLSQIPDVCRLSYTFDDELFIQRVSSEETRHMDKLTIVKKRKKKAKTSRCVFLLTSSKFLLMIKIFTASDHSIDIISHFHVIFHHIDHRLIVCTINHHRA